MVPATHVTLFTLHAYGTWLPDRPQGFCRNREGFRPSDPELARLYRRDMNDIVASFDGDAQRVLIDSILAASQLLQLVVYAIGTEVGHLHIVASWDDRREPRQLRRSLKRGISLRLDERFGSRQWFSRKGRCSAVEDKSHFLRLRDVYLPSHPGLFWSHVTGLREARRA